MSLVGPRPCLRYETEHFAPHHFERFLVPAGMTGLWQVTARAHSTFGEALDMDVAYARSWSLGLDLALLLQDAAAARASDGRPSDADQAPNRRCALRGSPSSASATGGRTSCGSCTRSTRPRSRSSATVSEAALAKIGRRYPAVRADDVATRTWSTDESIDAVVIATPVSTHFELALAALEAGKHVFVEKPLAGSSAEAETLIAAASAASLTLMPGHTFLYSPPVERRPRADPSQASSATSTSSRRAA